MKPLNRFRSSRVASAVRFAVLLALPALASAQAAVEYAQLAQAPGAEEQVAPAPTRRAAPASATRAQETDQGVMKGLNCAKGVTDAEQPVDLAIGKSTLLKLPGAVTYRTLGSPEVVHAVLVPPDGLYLLGRGAGSTNMLIQDRNGACRMIDVVVHVDGAALTQSLRKLLPNERDIQVSAAANQLVLTGTVDDASTAQRAVEIANAFMLRNRGAGIGGVGGMQNAMMSMGPGGPGGAAGIGQLSVINQLQVRAPQQVMLEVKIAEVSKSLLDKLGGSFSANRSIDGTAVSVLGAFGTTGGGALDFLRGNTHIRIDGQKDDGLIRVLAEPNLMAISGQQASFISGGKIFIPVLQPSALNGTPVPTLEEKNFGISVRFTPTVLTDRRINLNLISGVSDLSQTGSPFTTVNGVTSVLPSLTVREAATTVQLNDGQSLVIAGLIKNNSTETVRRFPGLGEVPVLGALFRSTEFQNDRSELLFVITPRLVKPVADAPRLPTDNHVVPGRIDRLLNGALESSVTPAPAAPAAQPNNAM